MEPKTKLATSRQEAGSAFSQIDLLVVCGVIMVLGALLMPAMARTRVNDQSFQCLNNLRNLMRAMQMYTHDYHDLFPPNPDDGNTTPGYNWCPGQAGIGSQNEFDGDLLKDLSRSLLAPYLATNITLFRCPSDTRTGRSTAASTLGQVVPAARNVSMNGAVGTDPYSKGGQLPVDGPWLDGTHSNTRNGPWFTFGKTTSIVRPSPATLLVLLDENPISVSDAGFQVTMLSSRFIDGPGSFHNFGCSLAFADGRCEIKKWLDARTSWTTFAANYLPPNPDVTWIQERTTALK